MIKEIHSDKELLESRSIEWDVRGNQQLSIQICQDLDDTIEAHPELLYLCGNEIGHKERSMDIRFSDDTYLFYNPVFQKVENLTLSREVDRINGKEYIVPRFSTVEVIFQDTLGSTKVIKVNDMAAIVICQAMDTMDGLFAHDIGLEILPEFDKASIEEKNEILRLYMESIPKLYKELNEELSNDSAVAQKWKAAKFLEAVGNGEIELEKREEKQLSKRKQKFFNRIAEKFKHNENRLKFWRKK